MGKRSTKRVVIALDLAKPDGRRKLSGIMRYLEARRVHWDIRIKRGADEFSEGGVTNFPNWNIDGVIYSLPIRNAESRLRDSESQKAARALAKLKTPLVVIDPADLPDFMNRKRNISIIRTDTESLGEAAADSFISQGRCKAFAFVPDVLDRDWSARRGNSFARALEARGQTCIRFQSNKERKDDFRELRLWLKSLPKPVGILVAYDDRALTVIEACSAEHLSIPRDVSILSVDNDDFLCENCVPTLSSIQPNHEKSGYAAGALLSAMMRKSTSKPHINELPIRSIVHRGSTLPVSSAGKLIHRALDYIRKNALKGIGPRDVVAHLGISRSLADIRFRELLKTSMGETIETARLEHVTTLLLTTNASIKEIASQSGFKDPIYLMHLFKRRMGITMCAYRRRNRGVSTCDLT